MITPSLTQEILQTFTQLNDDEQKSVLQMIKTFINTRKNDITSATFEEYNQELNEADIEIAKGNFISHEELMKRYSKK